MKGLDAIAHLPLSSPSKSGEVPMPRLHQPMLTNMAHHALPGGGRDPLLQGLPAALARCSASSCDAVQTAGGGHAYALRCNAAEVERMLAAIGLRAEGGSFELHLTQAAPRDWLKIPPVSEGFFAGRSPEERERLGAAYAEVDHRSWRRERWLGWTAWRAP